MGLTKQPISINFQKGLETKTDAYQVPAGNFLALNNSIFDTGGRLTKRNGFENLLSLPNAAQTTLTSLNDSLIATGSNLYAYSPNSNAWLNKGKVQPVALSTQPLVRVGTSQTSPDTGIASNGLTCLTYIDSGLAYYQISDSATGTQIVARTALPATAVCPRAFVLGNYFVVTFLATSGSAHLQYIGIPINNPSNPTVVKNFATDANSLSAGYDGCVVNNALYIAYRATGSAIKIAYITPSLSVSSFTSIASNVAELLSIYADLSRSYLFVSYWDSGTSNIHVAAFNYSLTLTMAVTTVATGVVITELTSAAQNGVVTVFYEIGNSYTYDATIRTDYIASVTCTLPATGVGVGTAGTPGVVLRSVGLASKAFIDSGTIYMLAAYGDTAQASSVNNSNQPTYFLIDSTGASYMRLAYSNGGGYAKTQVLPSVTLLNDRYTVAYLNNDFLASVNKGVNLPSGTPVNAIYTQTGVNLASIGINNAQQYSSEIANSLHLTGGQLWQYDGVKPVEHGFNLWAENLSITSAPTTGSMTAQAYEYAVTYEWTDNSGILHRSAPSIPNKFTFATPPASFTGHVISGDAFIFGVSSFTGLEVGQVVTNVGGLAANTVITGLFPGSSSLTISLAAISTVNPATFTVSAATATTINVPTLRITDKVSPNPVRIVGYRWSAAQQVFYQFTSLTSPTLNDPTVDYVSLTDTSSDAQILGNTVLYTTGGVLENIAAPASIASAMFTSRLFLIDAEDRNLLWYSKQVIESTPVEMSDLLTLYIAPTTGAQGSTGPMTALSAMDDKLIIFKRDAIYYINGAGPDNTGANSSFSDPVFITGTVGCTNPNSIVLMPNGIMFQSDKGLWILGRDLSTNYIGAPVQAYNTNTIMSALSIPGTNQVRFILDNNLTLVYDYFYNQWSTHSNISAISACLYQSTHTYLNSDGEVFHETPGVYLDGSRPVLMSLVTSWFNLAGIQGLERFYFANLLGTYYTPFKLNVSLSYNYNPSPTQSIIVTPDNYAAPYGGEALWGSGGPWGGPSNVFTARIFPEIQKCQSFQVSIQEVFDASLGTQPGQGLTLSGLNLAVGVKKGFRTQSAAKSFG